MSKMTYICSTTYPTTVHSADFSTMFRFVSLAINNTSTDMQQHMPF